MKTKTSLRAGLTMALLFGTAWSVAAIDFPVPKTPDVLTNAQKDIDKAASHKPTISSGPVLNADGKNPYVTLTWDAGPAHPSPQVTIQRANEPPHVNSWGSKGSIQVVIHSGTYLFTLRDGAETLASATATGSPTTPQAPQAESAGISASQSNGAVTLTWNTGSGHPNAEVWVKVNDHDEKLLFTGPKGTQTVTVKPGKKYVYMLRDSGQQLDTATVKAAGKSGQKHGHNDDE